MTSKITIKKSSVAAKVPLVGDLDFGELALNYADGALWYKTSGALIQRLNPRIDASNNIVPITTNTQTLGTGSLLWNNVYATTFTGALSGNATTATSVGSLTGIATVAPLIAGTAAVGTSTLGARQDHVHPVQTSVSGNAGTVTAVTASNFASQTANTFLSAPNGAAGVPTFRAIVAADVPTLNQNTTGSAASTPSVSVDNSITYGRSGLQFVQISGVAGDVATTTNTPTADWWHIIRGNHGNVAGFYTDLALPMTAATNIRYRRISAGVSSGWITVWDSTNLTNLNQLTNGPGYITSAGNAATATTLATARNINGVSFNGSADITVAAAAGTLSGTTLASGVTASSLTSVGTLGLLNITNDLTVSGKITNVRNKVNTVTANLGNPTVEEMALFHGEFTNKFRFIPAFTQEESTDGVTWTTSTRATANQLADIMLGEGQGSAFNAIPAPALGGSGYYRLTWDSSQTGYVFLNALYIYCSTSGNTLTFAVERNHNTTGWETVVSNTTQTWPGHVYIPHTLTPFNTAGTQYGKVRITFSFTSATYTNAFQLYNIEWFGGYPAGKRNVESYDRLKNVTFPAAITGTQLISNIATGTAPLTVASTTLVTNLNADLLDGLHLHTGTNNEVNKIVRTDANGFIQAGWISTTSGDNGTTALTKIYASSDGYIRYYTPTNFRTVLNVPTRTGGDASGTWAISVTGAASSNVLKAGDTMTGALTTTIGGGASDYVKHINLTNGTGYELFLLPRGGAGTYNALTQINDAVIAFSAGAIDTGGLVIGPWSAGSKGIRIDSSGNVGLGVVSSAWGTNFKAIESAGNSSVAIAAANINGINISSNAYNDNTNWLYKTTGTAARYSVNSNVHQWFIAPSGTAAAAITFTQAMTLDAGGNLGLGGTPSTGGYGRSFEVIHSGFGGALTAQAIDVDNCPVNLTANAVSSGAATFKYLNTASATRYEQVAGQHRFYTAASGTAGTAITFAERMRIDVSGNVTPGVTNTQTLGAVGDVWSNVYATTFTGALSGNATTATSVGSLTGIATVAPLVAGTAAVGTSTLGARQDHVHPLQTVNALSTASGSAPSYAARAWVNFDGTAAGTFQGGTVTVTRASGSTICNCTSASPHGLITGNFIRVSLGNIVTPPYIPVESYSVTVTGANTFTFVNTQTVAIASATLSVIINNIRGDGNVSTVSDESVGAYSINFSTPMPDINYATLATVGMGRNPNSTGDGNDNDDLPFIGEQNIHYVKIYVEGADDTAADKSYISVVIFR